MSIELQSPPVAPLMPASSPETKPAATWPAASPLPYVDQLYRLTVEQYHAMADAGILGEHDRIELIEGLLVHKMTKYRPHVIGCDLMQTALTLLVPVGWHVSGQNPILIAELKSEPEPDVIVVRGATRDYPEITIKPENVSLVVEVANTSLRFDQTVKKSLYARSSIPIYWILNIPDRRLEVYSDPTGPDPSPDFRRRVDLGIDQMVTLTLDGREIAPIAVRDLLP